MYSKLLVKDFMPRSQLVVPEHSVPRAKFRAIDAHNHLPMSHLMKAVDLLPTGDDGEGLPDLDQLVKEMYALNIRAIVNLSGGTGEILEQTLNCLDRAYEGRFITFCNVNWDGVGGANWIETATQQLEADVAAGARGLKVFKRLGLRVKDDTDALVMPDDPRIAPLWDKAAALEIPVLIHTADPVAFFRPVDRFNERWDELQRHPEWSFYGPEFPAFQELIASLYRLIEAHPETTFITAHVGCYPENLDFVSRMLEKHPNFYTDISARIAELGRAPYSTREWFIEYADRILFGTDERPSIPMYRTHFRFLETADEYFDYAPEADIPPQGRWKIYGVDLPDEVLKKVYHDNAARLLGLA
ncbi:MAG: amidohydrolase family protein [Chloroflexota bacterium]|nr:amidohydrolase family protein [Chloroflexota bacterium]